MSETNKPVFEINQQLFQQLVEWQEKIEQEDELASESEDEKSTDVKNAIASQDESSQKDNSQTVADFKSGDIGMIEE